MSILRWYMNLENDWNREFRSGETHQSYESWLENKVMVMSALIDELTRAALNVVEAEKESRPNPICSNLSARIDALAALLKEVGK